MSRTSDYTKVKEPTRQLVFYVPLSSIALLKYAGAWEKKTMTQMMTKTLNEFLEKWKEENPAKYELWRQQHEDCGD